MISTSFKKNKPPIFTAHHSVPRSVIVKNMEDPLHCACNCTGWLDHWMNCTNLSVVNCSNKMCTSIAKIGGQVKKMGEGDHVRYILPLCEECNSLEEMFEVKGMTNFVPAEERNLCNKG